MGQKVQSKSSGLPRTFSLWFAILHLYEEYFPHALELFEQELGRKLEARYLFNSTNLSVYLIESQL